jgi:hypothetical protein
VLVPPPLPLPLSLPLSLPLPSPAPSPTLPPVEEEQTSDEKTVTVDPLPVHQKIDINGKHKKKGRK